jgi:hypothetical protein
MTLNRSPFGSGCEKYLILEFTQLNCSNHSSPSRHDRRTAVPVASAHYSETMTAPRPRVPLFSSAPTLSDADADLDAPVVETAPAAALLIPPKTNFSPLPWASFFDTCVTVACADRQATFRCFINPVGAADVTASPPTVLPFCESTRVPDTSKPVVVFVHGAGHSALSFAACAQHMRTTFPVFALDLRGHGKLDDWVGLGSGQGSG